MHLQGLGKTALFNYTLGQAIVTGSQLAQARGPANGRNMARGFWMHFDGTGTTAGAATLGEDRVRIFGNVEVHLKDGTIVYDGVPADQIAATNFEALGADRNHDHADTGVGAGESLDAVLYVPLALPFEHDEELCGAVGVDEIAYIKWTFGVAADFALGSATISAIAGNYWIEPDIFESFSVHAPIRYVFRRAIFTSATQASFDMPGGKLRSLMLHKRGAEGGASLSTIPTVQIPALQMPAVLSDPDLLSMYSFYRKVVPGLAATQGGAVRRDIVRSGRAISVVLPDGKDTAAEGPTLAGPVTVNFPSSTVTVDANGPWFLYRVALPQDDAYLAKLDSMYPEAAGQPWAMATKGHTKTDPASWDPNERKYIGKRKRLPTVRRGM